jgi:secretion/DNA translocation related CpaE-like protein
MTSRWVLLLTDDPSIAGPTARLAESVGLRVRFEDDLPPGGSGPPGAGPPGLVLLGVDRLGLPSVPSVATGVPTVLVAAGEPEERFWRAALELRVEQVILLPEAEPSLLERLSRLAVQPDRRALVIAVTGGCGGAGASVLAAALARAAVRFTRSLLVEVDQWGGGADLLLGAEDEPGLRWPDLASVRGRLLPGSVFGGLPVIDGLHVLSWDRRSGPIEVPAAAGSSVLDLAVQEFGIVVLDLPRRLDPVAEVAARASDLALLVVPARIRAAAAAHRVLAGLRQHLAEVRLIVRGPVPPRLPAEHLAAALGLPLAGRLKPEPGLAEALERGEPPGLRVRSPLSVLCHRLLASEMAGREPELVR